MESPAIVECQQISKLAHIHTKRQIPNRLYINIGWRYVMRLPYIVFLFHFLCWHEYGCVWNVEAVKSGSININNEKRSDPLAYFSKVPLIVELLSWKNFYWFPSNNRRNRLRRQPFLETKKSSHRSHISYSRISFRVCEMCEFMRNSFPMPHLCVFILS